MIMLQGEIFMKKWILSIALAGFLGIVGCSGDGGWGGGDGGEEDGEPSIVCVSSYDCDGDGLNDGCDSAPNDATIIIPTSSCDADGDGHTDVACSSYDTNGDSTMS